MAPNYHPYRDAAYAKALSGAGDPIEVTAWGTWALRRPIPGGTLLDAAGLYPLVAFGENADLGAGRYFLESSGLVSFVGVTDPFTAPTPEMLASVFDVCRPFKQHAVIDRRVGPPDFSRHHRSEIKRAARRCVVEKLPLSNHIDRWVELYEELITHRNITGMAAFSRQYFERLASMPTIGCFAARHADGIVAMSLWLRSDRIAYYHLAASNSIGYGVSASYLIQAAAIEEYADCDVINLGGVAGFKDSGDDGLARFKRGFANSSATAHLCGMVLDREVYAALAAGGDESGYFPAYRASSAATHE